MHDNVLDILPDIASLEQCRVICQDAPSCAFLTHFGSDSYPFKETCMLFSECSELHAYPDCITEEAACWALCSSPVESQMSGNLVQFLPDVEDERLCRDGCRNHTSCKYYTHHNNSDPFFPAGACFLMSGLEEPLLPCDFCR